MRIDLFLKETRIIKRRTIAKEFCERGLVSVNDKVVKPAFDIKEGDKFSVKLGNKILTAVAHIDSTGKKEKGSYEPL
ncbi:MAG: RNA-binding S4 domain-containing protein [Bacilli bacterium]|nr:RNA-binding S4 domain-containing protein [Bacilli bacterium]